ncbi:hypothetical protein G6T08_003455 [Salmonella enterica]|uniref:Uncharacterized protein n=1 Tax=Salmonella diarizonae TaxID=59204 RepID=A0A5Y1Y9B7_SALDZ|nr:hypothetical protein [Salmonella enterica]ECB2072276.1 hypothetical protein [Salmonella enterica subsp. enterica serovar Benin]ECC3914705.1 hypothetical protein [Salmonella enterica subsp. diarizonae]EBE6987741.1 hypothetical protein [Salmonella enterica]EBE7298404.1 hypothetical protein [Salmonella enterica]
MKNINILAVAAALSAVMTGSAFAAATAGQTLPITVALSSTAVNYATAVAHNVTIPENGIIPADTKLATISNLPAGATLVDTSSSTTGQIKFTQTGGSATFQAKAYVAGESAKVVSANATPGSATQLQEHGTVTVATVDAIKNAQPGVYVSTPVIYTYAE